MIIVEGMDNSGKTKLANYLASSLGKRVIKSPGPTSGEIMLNWILMHVLADDLAKYDMIFDRFPLISESIYGPVIRKENKLQVYDLPTLWSILKSVNPLIIYCKPPLAKIIDFGSREQMDKVVTHAITLIDEYDSLMRNLSETGFNVVKYDFCNPVINKDSMLDLADRYFWIKENSR